MVVICNDVKIKNIESVSIYGILDFRNLPVVEKWVGRGYFHFGSKILPHTPKNNKAQLPLG